MSITELSMENSFFVDFRLDLPFVGDGAGKGIKGDMLRRLGV